MVHQSAGEGFGREALTYQRARPAYHPDLVVRFINRYGSGDILEIGAGTGIFTQQIADRCTGLVAVEPVPAMRERLMDALPDVDVREGTAEALPVASGAFDTVVVAQSFHWFQHRQALDEIDRVLRGGGHLVTVWNVKAGDASWFARYMEIIDRHAGETPRHADMRWRAAIDADERFELVDDWKADHPQTTDSAGVISRALSTSFIAALPQAAREQVIEDLRAALEAVEEPLDFPYRAELQAWRRRH
jgi:SAM-dependent methyltransferase